MSGSRSKAGVEAVGGHVFASWSARDRRHCAAQRGSCVRAPRIGGIPAALAALLLFSVLGHLGGCTSASTEAEVDVEPVDTQLRETSDSQEDPDAAGEEALEGVWLRGDLHVHSDHSNDALDNPMSIIRPLAESFGMDYFVVTDHDNHVNGVLTTWDDPDYRSDTMTILYGVEMTMPGGHANILASERWDHAPFWAAREDDTAVLIEESRRQGVHFSINHPTSPDSWRRGYAFEFDSLEVWNAVFVVPSNNDQALELWDSFLMEGRRIAGRGGSDCHHQEGSQGRTFNIGNPTTWVFAEDRSGAAILEALTRGRATVSYAPGAERIELHADPDGDGNFSLMMGDNLPVATGEPIRLRVRVQDARSDETYTVRVIRNGETFQERSIEAESGVAEWILDDTPPTGERKYYRVEVRATSLPLAPAARVFLYGDMVGLTNPIYVGFPDATDL